MPLDGASLDFTLSVDAALPHGGTAQPDPNDALGGAASSTPLHDIESTITSTMTDAFVFVDTARIGAGADEFTGDWIQFVTGTNFLVAVKVKKFESTTGVFVLQDSIGLATSGDSYQIYKKNNLFDDVDAAESAAGATDYRQIWVDNNCGVTLNGLAYYLNDIDQGSIAIELLADRTSATLTEVLATETTAPDPVTDPAFGGSNEVFSKPEGPAGRNQPADYNSGGLSTAQWGPCWVKRIVPQSTFGRQEVVIQVVMLGTNTGGNPDPITSGYLIIFDVAGFAPALTVAPDRNTHIGGGCRVIATVKNGAIALQVPVEWEKTAGVGTLSIPTDQISDSDGAAQATYNATNTPGDAGSTVTIEAKV